MANEPKNDKTENASQPPAGQSGSKPMARDRAKPASAELGVRLSEKAAEQIKTIIAKNEYPDTMYLYVGVKGGGCSGLEYVLDLRDEAHVPLRDDDEVFESHGVLVVCDLKSFIVGNLNGTEVNYQDDSLMGAGFSFNNPNAQNSCGCGASYST